MDDRGWEVARGRQLALSALQYEHLFEKRRGWQACGVDFVLTVTG